jgi:hypothetical protein
MSTQNPTWGDFLAQKRTKVTISDTVFGCNGHNYMRRPHPTGEWVHGRMRCVVYRGTSIPGAFIVDKVLTLDDLDVPDSRFLQESGTHAASPTGPHIGDKHLQTRRVALKHIKGALQLT